jgi:hypothetical protein
MPAGSEGLEEHDQRLLLVGCEDEPETKSGEMVYQDFLPGDDRRVLVVPSTNLANGLPPTSPLTHKTWGDLMANLPLESRNRVIGKLLHS